MRKPTINGIEDRCSVDTQEITCGLADQKYQDRDEICPKLVRRIRFSTGGGGGS